MSVLYFFAMFVMFFPTLVPHAHRPGWSVPGSAGECTGTALAPSAHPAQYDTCAASAERCKCRAGQVTGVVEVV